MTRSEMREEVASEDNNLMLAKRDIPMIERALWRAKQFREGIAEDHCFSSGDAIENFLDRFDEAHGELLRTFASLSES
jgi:hypothetical protein